MEGIANFIDDLMGGLMLISFSIAIGALVWGLLLVKSGQKSLPIPLPVIKRCIRLLYLGAFALAAVHFIELMVKAWVLAETLDEFSFTAYINTIQFKAGLVRGLLALGLGGAAYRLVDNPQKNWFTVCALAGLTLISGAWLVHAVGRFENRVPLMALTVLHQFAAAVWFGGVVQLLALWRLTRRDSEYRELWPLLLSRFSVLGISAVALLLLTGLPLAWSYVKSLDGLLGTGYGSLIVTKSLLLMAALSLAHLNFKAGRHWRSNGHSTAVSRRVPYYIEAEAFILISILFVAATLSSQPPAADIPHLTASASEVIEMFKPKIPRLASPSHEELLAGEAGRVAIIGKTPSPAATEWSDFNHNISGIILVAMAIVAVLSYRDKSTWTKYWPLGFIALGLFLFFRSDAETWPLGPIGFWESTFGNGEVLQHRIATLLVLVLGILEMRARIQAGSYKRLPYLFPILCAVGSILLLTHAHTEFELKSEYLIQATHTAMGLLAIILASGRWLELRLSPTGNVAGFVSVSALFLIGSLLMFYREPLF